MTKRKRKINRVWNFVPVRKIVTSRCAAAHLDVTNAHGYLGRTVRLIGQQTRLAIEVPGQVLMVM